jgi:hypothetical protein
LKAGIVNSDAYLQIVNMFFFTNNKKLCSTFRVSQQSELVVGQQQTVVGPKTNDVDNTADDNDIPSGFDNEVILPLEGESNVTSDGVDDKKPAAIPTVTTIEQLTIPIDPTVTNQLRDPEKQKETAGVEGEQLTPNTTKELDSIEVSELKLVAQDDMSQHLVDRISQSDVVRKIDFTENESKTSIKPTTDIPQKIPEGTTLEVTP